MMRRICCFCETWSTGGIEAFLCRLLSAMDKTELQIDLVAVRLDSDSVFTPALEGCGVRMVELSGSKNRWLSNLWLFYKLLKERDYDVVHLNAFQGLQLVYLWLAKLAGVTVRIAHSHGSDLRKSRLRSVKLLLHRVGKMLFGHAATVRWACSGSAADFMFSKSARFIPNGIDTERFWFDPQWRGAVRRELRLENAFVIGSVGRLVQEKNHAFLLDVLAVLLPQRPESVLLLVGDGPARQELQEKAAVLGVADQVIFYGVSDRPEELLWAMDAFAFPSFSEGLGIVAVEAQAAGLPVICSEHIPEEAKLTKQVQTVLLTAGASAWAEALMQTSGSRQEREVSTEAVRQAGYEVFDVAELVRSTYVS